MAATYTNHAISSISGDVTPSALFLAPNMIDWTKKLRRTDAPLLTTIGRGKAPAQPAVKLEWGFSYPDADTDQLNGAISSTSATTFTVDDASKFQVGDLVLIESEVIRLTAINETTNVLTGDRGYAGTTAATHVDNMSILILPPAIAEHQATPLSGITQGEKDYNYFQQMEFSVQLSHRAQVIPTQETLSLKLGDRAQAELRKKMEDTIPSKLENAILFGYRAIGTTANASTMGGIMNTTTFVTGNRDTSLSGALTWGTLMEELQVTHNLVGNKIGLTAMAHPTVCEIISSFFEDTRRSGTSDKKIATYWREFDTDYGVLKLMPNYKMVKTAANGPVALDQILFFNPDDLELVPLSGDSGWSMEPIETNGWFDQIAIRGDFTLKAQNPDTRTLLGGFSTTRSDYSGLA